MKRMGNAAPKVHDASAKDIAEALTWAGSALHKIAACANWKANQGVAADIAGSFPKKHADLIISIVEMVEAKFPQIEVSIDRQHMNPETNLTLTAKWVGVGKAGQ